MSKLHLWCIALLIIAVIAFVPFTIEILGDMNSDLIAVFRVCGIMKTGIKQRNLIEESRLT